MLWVKPYLSFFLARFYNAHFGLVMSIQTLSLSGICINKPHILGSPYKIIEKIKIVIICLAKSATCTHKSFHIDLWLKQCTELRIY